MYRTSNGSMPDTPTTDEVKSPAVIVNLKK